MKSFSRLIAILLVTCLITDPSTAFALTHPLSPTWERAGVRGDIFQEQALANRLAAAFRNEQNRLVAAGICLGAAPVEPPTKLFGWAWVSAIGAGFLTYGLTGGFEGVQAVGVIPLPDFAAMIVWMLPAHRGLFAVMAGLATALAVLIGTAKIPEDQPPLARHLLPMEKRVSQVMQRLKANTPLKLLSLEDLALETDLSTAYLRSLMQKNPAFGQNVRTFLHEFNSRFAPKSHNLPQPLMAKIERILHHDSKKLIDLWTEASKAKNARGSPRPLMGMHRKPQEALLLLVEKVLLAEDADPTLRSEVILPILVYLEKRLAARRELLTPSVSQALSERIEHLQRAAQGLKSLSGLEPTVNRSLIPQVSVPPAILGSEEKTCQWLTTTASAQAVRAQFSQRVADVILKVRTLGQFANLTEFKSLWLRHYPRQDLKINNTIRRIKEKFQIHLEPFLDAPDPVSDVSRGLDEDALRVLVAIGMASDASGAVGVTYKKLLKRYPFLKADVVDRAIVALKAKTLIRPYYPGGGGWLTVFHLSTEGRKAFLRELRRNPSVALAAPSTKAVEGKPDRRPSPSRRAA